MLCLLLWSCSQAQEHKNKVGGHCEGCEAVLEYGNKHLSPTDTLPDYNLPGKHLKITGTIFKNDGKTPAPGIILYIYHTNTKGIYARKGNERGWAKKHGYIRGWIKTGTDGKYTFYTLRPVAYPDRSEPEHIHPLIKEPGVNAYYIDEYVFDDALLSAEKRNRLENRGGNGIVKPVKKNGFYEVKRDIVLGRNIPDYD